MWIHGRADGEHAEPRSPDATGAHTGAGPERGRVAPRPRPRAPEADGGGGGEAGRPPGGAGAMARGGPFVPLPDGRSRVARDAAVCDGARYRPPRGAGACRPAGRAAAAEDEP